MRYYKTSQPVPGKGDATIYYECDDDQKVLRYVTHIDGTGELERVADPIVKKLYRPDMLRESSQEEFEQYWNQGG
ncbi:MAG TPA: hypothetical protein PLB67_10085 [Candidatus Hydrogenedentes bacterium]|jgi:hypothetical protein|nr:hypothetical protein [Candidatus Hydrogenedentota bacterium]MDY0031474.1 hypothetical protein [FCB group bacterium]HNZ17060.1 hypothetical protein [Candidatus Hydrogenedentota bacterium]HOH32729.1 hypothetical protein [Candidatus Hydrogenedentota bacterium]HPA04779.1 hypothetical protein [Candidatus Hydrogenedentota bacterium]